LLHTIIRFRINSIQFEVCDILASASLSLALVAVKARFAIEILGIL